MRKFLQFFVLLIASLTIGASSYEIDGKSALEEEGYEFSKVILTSSDDEILINNYDVSVRSVGFGESVLFRVPVEIIHEGLYVLKLDDTNISQISRGDFANGTFIRALQLGFNPIEVLENDTFELTPALEKLDLQSCQISEIQVEAFKGLTVLKKLLLPYNKLTSFPENVFDSLVNLRQLSLLNNQLHTLSPNVFLHNIKMSELNLAQNNLSSLPSFEMQKKTMKALSIYENELITQLDLSDFQILNMLHAGGCRISNLVATNLESLTFVDLSSNNLTNYNVLENNTKLWYINLSGNRIGHLGTILLPFKKLQFLYLENTWIKAVNASELEGLTKLKKLELSNNGLETIAFPRLPKLNELIVRENKLTTLSLKKNVLPKLKEVNLSSNLFKCIELAKLLKYLQKRDINVELYNKSDRMSVNLRRIGCLSEKN